MTRSTSRANKEVGPKPKRSTPKTADNEDIDPEDPILQEEHSDDDDPKSLFGVDQSLLDPEEEGTGLTPSLLSFLILSSLRRISTKTLS